MSDIDEISTRIARFEPKDSYTGHPDFSYFDSSRIVFNGKICDYFVYPCRRFKELIIDEQLVDAISHNPTLFGTDNTTDVLKGIYKTISRNIPFEVFADIISREQFAYIGELDSNGIKKDGNILRLDLYRLDHRKEFTGGVFHALKHFSLRGEAMTAQKGEIDIRWVKHFMDAVIRAFLCADLVPDYRDDSQQTNEYVSRIEFLEHSFKFVFYFNKDADVYYLNTAYVEDSKIKKQKL